MNNINNKEFYLNNFLLLSFIKYILDLEISTYFGSKNKIDNNTMLNTCLTIFLANINKLYSLYKRYLNQIVLEKGNKIFILPYLKNIVIIHKIVL